MCDNNLPNQKFAQRRWPGVKIYDDFNGIPNKCLNVETQQIEAAPEAGSWRQKVPMG